MNRPPIARLAERAEDPAPFLGFLERSWSRREIWQEARAAAAGLAALELEAARPVGVLLPNLPGAVVALFATWLAGRPAALVDARRPLAALQRWVEAERPAALVTLDLASVFERARTLAEMQPSCRLIVMPIAGQLGFWKRLIVPWLRGGGAAKRPEGLELIAWRDLLARAPGAVEARDPNLPEPDPWPGKASGLLACPLADPQALAALLAAWCGEGRLILSPRLDQRALDKVRKAGRPDLVIGADPPKSGSWPSPR